MLKDHVTLPQYLAAHGYSTFVAGKIFHDGSIPPEARATEVQAWGIAGGMPYPPEKFVATPDAIKAMDWGVFPEHDEDQADWKIADAAIDRLRSLPPASPSSSRRGSACRTSPSSRRDGGSTSSPTRRS